MKEKAREGEARRSTATCRRRGRGGSTRRSVSLLRFPSRVLRECSANGKLFTRGREKERENEGDIGKERKREVPASLR